MVKFLNHQVCDHPQLCKGLKPHQKSFNTKVEPIYFGRKATSVKTKPFGHIFVCARTKLIKPEKNCLATSDIKKIP